MMAYELTLRDLSERKSPSYAVCQVRPSIEHKPAVLPIILRCFPHPAVPRHVYLAPESLHENALA